MNEHTDTRLTDYALGELSETEQHQVEALLKDNVATRGEVEELQRLGKLLRDAALPASELGADAAATSGESLRAHVEQRLAAMQPQAAPSTERASWLRTHWRAAAATVGFGGILAASLASMIVGSGQFRRGAASSSRSDAELLLAQREPNSSTKAADDIRQIYDRSTSPSSLKSSTGTTTINAGSMSVLADSDINPGGPQSAQGLMKSGAGTQVFALSARATPVPPPALAAQAVAASSAAPPHAGEPMQQSVAAVRASRYTPAASLPAPPVANPVPAYESLQNEDSPRAALPLLLEHRESLAKYGPKHPKVVELELKLKAEIDQVERLKRDNGDFNMEAYDALVENPFLRIGDAPLSTFSIDVDTASYANVRRFLNSGELPPPDAVRLEEFVNYFTYDYPQPNGDDPFSVTTEAARCPWNGDHFLVRVGLKGREIHRKERPATNLVFLVDVSGSMQDANKLPLVRESLKMLVRELGDGDRVAIVVYAGSSGLALAPTGGDRKQTILEAVDRLEAGGSTNGAAGIQLAYQLAAEHFIKGGANRVVLATDGDFNVGVTNQGELVRLIEEKAKTGVFFSALGYGMGNLKDSTLEKLADKGNGDYAYIDSLAEARKVLVEQMSGTLVTIAKDVKIQIEFNPARVAAYRLLGYENRILAAQDFNDDKKDAGEIGAGHTVTALYELIPAGKAGAKETKQLPQVDPLKYQQPKHAGELTDAATAKELLTLKLRYKQPDGDKSKLLEQSLRDEVQPYAKASDDLKFSSSVAAFGMLLRHSKYHGSATFDAVLELAQAGIGSDPGGYRKEFLELVRKAKILAKKP